MPRLLPILSLLCLAALAPPAGAQLPFVYYGRVLLADPAEPGLRLVGTLSPAATVVAADPRGWIWGRLEPRHLAALDPATGELAARVRLPHKAYSQLLITDGKAYVTHASLTKEGYTLSVLDTRTLAPPRELSGLAGLGTDLVQAGGFVYVAAEGVGENRRYSYLYRIEGQAGPVREVARLADAGYFWKLAAAGDRLYVGYLPVKDDPRVGLVEVRDAATAAPRTRREELPGPLRGLYAAGGRVLLFCDRGEGGTDLLLLEDPLLRGPGRLLALQGPVARVLGVRDSTLVYLDYPMEHGYREVSLCFFDLEQGRELRRFSVRDFLLAGTEQGGRLRR